MDSTIVILTLFCPNNMYNMWAFEPLCKKCNRQGLKCIMPQLSKNASPNQKMNSTILKLARFYPKYTYHMFNLEQRC